MQQFLNYIIDFLYDFYFFIFIKINTFFTDSGARASILKVSPTNYNDFLDKTIFNGDLLTIGITWRELLNYFLPILIAILIIILFIRYFLKLLGLFRLD